MWILIVKNDESRRKWKTPVTDCVLLQSSLVMYILSYMYAANIFHCRFSPHH